MKKLILIGGGGHSKVVLDIMLAQGQYELAGIGDDKYLHTFSEFGIAHGPIADMLKLLEEDNYYLIIAIGSNHARCAVEQRLGLSEHKYAVLIHPKATIGSGVTVGKGSVIMPGAVMNYGSEIGKHCIINTGAIIEHEDTIGNYVHLSPAAALGGDVTIEDGVHIGIGAKIIEGRTVGCWSTLGAGAVAIKDIPRYCTAVGVPAKVVKFVQNPEMIQRRT
ncbi:acetyltransferase [Paenibacillus sp. Soil787]|uniref:acetyltransferase n=1 Tax=Paenibacillus sp. Soil787 TaxID=1736411 RepID=UPI0007028776|nr:acetyltransferase [Paenibacillus sp. Soil787]KRF21588.1 acetyltransferase [Paenibacillus sp. Soil787]